MSRPHNRHLRALGAAVALGLVLSVGVAAAAGADDYPSWDDVLAARSDEAATNTAISDIEGILADLETESAALGREAQLKAEELNSAKVALENATARATSLADAAASAEKRALVSSQQAGQLIAQLARTGSGNLSVALMASPDAGDLLGSLGTAGKVAERATTLYEQATQDRNRAEVMTAQAKLAENERKTLSATAETALASAQQAADAVQARIAEKQAASDQLYEQLATLKGTTSDVENRYMEGLREEQEQAAQPPAPPVTGPAPNPTPPAPDASAASGAIAFAYAQLGKPYVFGGSGPWGWDCSGLTKAAYESVGVYIGAHLVSSQYYTMAGAGRLVPLGAMAPGDLIYYADGGYPGSFYHVTMYVGDGMMIEAPREGVPVRVTAVRYYDALPYAGRPTG